MLLPYSDYGATLGMMLISAIIIGVGITVGTLLKHDESNERNLSFVTVLSTIFGGTLALIVMSHLIYGR